MKVSNLLAHYLYQKKRLNLPGLGSFFIADDIVVPDLHDKNFREFLQYIQFSADPATKFDKDLIDYIRTQTGKIKPLAEADLEAFVAEGKELLNISKPFFVDGVGVLQKNRNSQLEFSTGEPMMESLPSEPKPEHQTRVNPFTSELAASRQPSNMKGVLNLVIMILALVLIVSIGYLWYSKNSDGDAASNPQTNRANAASAPDTTNSFANTDTSTVKTDTIASNGITPSAVPGGQYKFVFETTSNKSRALRRFAFVHMRSPLIQMETTDSVTFKIFVVLPSLPQDTTYKKDSLNAWYYGTRKVKVNIEQ